MWCSSVWPTSTITSQPSVRARWSVASFAIEDFTPIAACSAYSKFTTLQHFLRRWCSLSSFFLPGLCREPNKNLAFWHRSHAIWRSWVGITIKCPFRKLPTGRVQLRPTAWHVSTAISMARTEQFDQVQNDPPALALHPGAGKSFWLRAVLNWLVKVYGDFKHEHVQKGQVSMVLTSHWWFW